jgi:DNA-binding Lrp family transcriptional regulator
VSEIEGVLFGFCGGIGNKDSSGCFFYFFGGAMIFQERDAKILCWINGFGFASADHIKRFMGVGQTAAYVRLKKLVDNGYLTRERILHGQARIHKVTKKGVQASDDGILPLKYVNLGTFRHDFKLLDLALMLEQKTGGQFTPDRRIRHDEGLSGVGQLGHIPDGYLHIGEDKPIAVELELSVKSRARIENIVNEYGGNLNVKEVWYYTDNREVARAISKAAQGFSFIRVEMINE